MNRVLPPHSSFTSTQTPIQFRLISRATVRTANGQVEGKAQWDTGATNTCISKKVVDDLKLIPTGRKTVHTPSGNAIQNTYLVDIELPNNVTMTNVMVFGSEIGAQGIDVLIGMDIISRGDFAVSNFEGTTKFSFRSPSVKHTDFVQETNASNIMGKIQTHGQGSTRKRHKASK